MKRLTLSVAAICLIFFFSLILIPDAFSQVSNPNVTVVSYSWYVNSSGNFIVVGEVQNTGNSVLESVSLNAEVRAADDSQLATTGTPIRAYVSYLLPQEKAPFYIDFGNPGSSAISRVSSVTFTTSIAPQINNKQYSDLSVHTVFNNVSNGYYVVIGAVTNVGNQTAKDVRVVATYYNSSGAVVAVGYVLLNDLTAENSTAFSVAEFDATNSLVTQISDYALIVQTATLQNNSTSSPSPSPSAIFSGSSDWIYIIIVVVIVFAIVAVVLVFLRKRRNLAVPPPPPPPPPE
jgi:hypothetical protein